MGRRQHLLHRTVSHNLQEKKTSMNVETPLIKVESKGVLMGQ